MADDRERTEDLVAALLIMVAILAGVAGAVLVIASVTDGFRLTTLLLGVALLVGAALQIARGVRMRAALRGER